MVIAQVVFDLSDAVFDLVLQVIVFGSDQIVISRYIIVQCHLMAVALVVYYAPRKVGIPDKVIVTGLPGGGNQAVGVHQPEFFRALVQHFPVGKNNLRRIIFLFGFTQVGFQIGLGFLGSLIQIDLLQQGIIGKCFRWLLGKG
ncbi:hypothetical protein KJK34_03510 [Flavobacterium sp. D11R37]|uniref:hypothetical protein n=1 Tax=Flavobacterium coralii TaxID=2838017 RepID=UPI001CA78AF7|nr:hypothetical protein [Flavobacterium coralii]MBY8961814.1 hypothetical protein [Flavobacterium coralii]